MTQKSAPESLEEVASEAVKTMEEFYQTKTVSLAHFETSNGDTFREIRRQHLLGVSDEPHYVNGGTIAGGILSVEKDEFPESYKTLQNLAKEGKLKAVGLFKQLITPTKYPFHKTVQKNPKPLDDLGPNPCQR